MSAAPAASTGQHHRTGSLINWGFIKIEPMTASRGATGFAQRTRDCRGRLAIRTISAVLLAMAGMAALVGVQVASESAVGAAYVSSFSINDPGSLSGTSGQAITPVEFIASNVDASTGPVATSIKWTAGQLPSGLSLSPAGVLSGTLSASIPGGLYDLRIIASERVTSGSRGLKSVNCVTTDLATLISISGPSVFSSNQITIASSGLRYPSGVAVDTSGQVFVADTYNNRIVSMNADGSNQTTIAATGFSYPMGVAVDTSGHVFVADSGNSRIVSMNADGSNQTAIGSGLSYPLGVAVDTSGHVFVAESPGTQIVSMNADGSNQTTIGSGFDGPWGVAVDTSGQVFVADTYNNRIVSMNADGSNQTTIGSGFDSPWGVAVDTSRHVFVGDTNNNRIVSMNADGSNQTTIGSGFNYPSGVAVDTSRHVFVGDTNNNQIVAMNAGFRIPDQSVPGVQAGQAAAPTQLESESVDPSTAPKVTSVKWFASDLPAGLKLSSKGVLSGTPKVQLLGTYSIYLTATETVTKVVGKVKTVTTRATSQVLWVIVS